MRPASEMFSTVSTLINTVRTNAPPIVPMYFPRPPRIDVPPITVAATGQVFQGIIDGTVAAGNVQQNGYMGWVHVDRMARLALGLPLVQQSKAERLPTYVVDSPAQARTLVKRGYWDGPAGYQAAFNRLWRVSNRS